VAISRARCLAVVVANPRLLDAPCNTIEQMKLVNTLCFVKAYADRSASAKDRRGYLVEHMMKASEKPEPARLPL
jgi:hypothetical protein